MQTIRRIDDLMQQVTGWVRPAGSTYKPPRSLSTGLFDLDQLTGGLKAGSLTILAGRPSMGKTTLALNIAQHVASIEKLPTVFFSLDINELDLTARVAASAANVSAFSLSNGRSVDAAEWGRLNQVVEQLRHTDLYLGTTTDIHDIENCIRNLGSHGVHIGLVVVDYLQLFLPYCPLGLEGADPDYDRTRALEEILTRMKLLAEQLDFAVVVLWQLGPEVDQRSDKCPAVGDLRLTEFMERNIDLVMMLYRDELYNRDSSTAPGIADIYIGKQKNGPTGLVRVDFQSRFAKFKNLAMGSA
jgi:replicative DNA helicase